MKRIVLFITLLTVMQPCQSKAGCGNGLYDTEDILPQAEFGGKAGLQMCYLSGTTPWNETYKYGPLVGLFLGVHRKMIGGRIEANIRQVKFRSNLTKSEAEIINFDVPILFEFRPIKEIKIHIGPQLTAYASVKDHNKDISRWFTGQEIGGAFGIEGDIPWRFTVGARVIKGFTNINDYNVKSGKWTTTSAQFYIGFRLIE